MNTELMRRALALAAKALFTTTPNPRVGCVLLKNGEIIGEGHTQPPGQAHAEVEAIAAAKRNGHDPKGATAYVTLEPCSHFGRTPPCADLLIDSGIAKVVVAIEDPNPLVAGQGVTRLRAAGIEVVTGVCADEAREINIGFFSRMQRGVPWRRLKVAASIDGVTALSNGTSKWITGEAARHDGHLWRARACAILTGIGTVKADDPQLSVRNVDTPRQPLRIVVDSRLEIDPDARVLASSGALVVAAHLDAEKKAILEHAGHEVVILPGPGAKVDLPALMHELGRRQINELHIEAGTKLNGSLIQAGCVDELLMYFAPTLLGEGQGMFGMPALQRLDEGKGLSFRGVQQVGEDLRILARLKTA